MANKKTSASKKRSKSSQRINSTWIWVGGVLIIALLAVGAIYIVNQSGTSTASLPTEVSVDQAYQMYQDGAFVLDVRTPEEWDDYHAPGTTLIPLDQLASRVNEVPPDKEVLVVCRSGNRSQSGRDILLNAGFEQVTSMSGGLTAWGNAGYPLEGGTQ